MKSKYLILSLFVSLVISPSGYLTGQTIQKKEVNKTPELLARPGSSPAVKPENGFKVIPGSVLFVGINSAKCGGSVIKNTNADIISVGLCWNIRPNPLISDFTMKGELISGSFSCTINGLLPSTLYFLRAYAITGKDTSYSENKIFYTHRPDAVSDADGNYYNTVKIGKQVWLGEDLKTTKLRDGGKIELVPDTSWGRRITPAYSWYANDSVKYSFPGGKLYNWYAVNTGKLCPAGWHVPADSEWMALSMYLGGDSIAGGKMKTTGTIFWREPNKKASNITGFSAVPGGYRNSSGVFSSSTFFDNWWSSDVLLHAAANYWYVYHATGFLYHEPTYKMFGYSVRCIKD